MTTINFDVIPKSAEDVFSVNLGEILVQFNTQFAALVKYLRSLVVVKIPNTYQENPNFDTASVLKTNKKFQRIITALTEDQQKISNSLIALDNKYSLLGTIREGTAEKLKYMDTRTIVKLDKLVGGNFAASYSAIIAKIDAMQNIYNTVSKLSIISHVVNGQRIIIHVKKDDRFETQLAEYANQKKGVMVGQILTAMGQNNNKK